MIRTEGTYTQHVVHQCPSTGANFDELDSLLGLTLSKPLGNEPDADKLAKDL